MIQIRCASARAVCVCMCGVIYVVSDESFCLSALLGDFILCMYIKNGLKVVWKFVAYTSSWNYAIAMAITFWHLTMVFFISYHLISIQVSIHLISFWYNDNNSGFSYFFWTRSSSFLCKTSNFTTLCFNHKISKKEKKFNRNKNFYFDMNMQAYNVFMIQEVLEWMT